MMKVFAILCAVFIILVCLATPARSEALPEDCVRSKTPRTGSLGVYGVAVTCNSRGLTTFPDHIPPDTFDLKMTNNRIRNVPYIPPLRYLNILDLSRNRIETLSWGSLCNLPTPAFGNTTKNGGLTAGTAIVKRDKPVFRTVHIIIMTTAGLLGLVFAVCLTLKFVRECRLQNANRAANNISVPLRVLSTDNQSTSQTGPPSAIELSQLIPNSLYNRNNPAAVSHVQTTTNTQLSQLVPPIANSLYHRNSPATMPEQPRLPTPLPPIQNVSYHSTNPAALSSEEPDRTYEYIP
ncbi:PREDICTED: uncharacterized protein LOC109483892 [Branchiostoma belcheri]|uniref:Uncharacterized protein LOC109483892 n=1 Tax=Branchiostoma belcheri TaxID=7741 RepID=A0A6P5AKP0_BRABE|nr:PREDICTED: uncharacterized protein LOC109483892 [Branchiostoma belcheri]